MERIFDHTGPHRWPNHDEEHPECHRRDTHDHPDAAGRDNWIDRYHSYVRVGPDTIITPAQPPAGYRWATEDEIDRPDVIVVPLTVDASGTPYTHNEADLAVPITPSFNR
jgi:hypothetical protein